VTSEVRPLENGWLPDTPVEDSLLRKFLCNQSDAQAELALAVGGRCERTPDVVLTDLGIPEPMLNQAVLLRPLSGPDDPVLEVVAKFFRGAQGSLLSAWPTPDLAGRGWQLVGHPMFVARGAWQQPPAIFPGVDVRVAASAADLALAERLAVDGYPMPELDGLPPNSMFGPALIDGPMTHRIGCVDGQPVGAAAAYVAHGVVNLCFAATLPAARRRGVWQSLVAARCSDAPELPAMAFTSDYSRPGFIRLGFLPLWRATFWAVASG
jgi:hypothetical protein